MPALQILQSEEPAVSEYLRCFFSQGVQDEEPSEDAYFALSHFWHVRAPLKLYLPVEQFVVFFFKNLYRRQLTPVFSNMNTARRHI